MKKKALAIAIAGALVSPTAFAAEDEFGMRYTSAAEGFYGSIRTGFYSGDTDDKAAQFQDINTRLGVRGSNDLGNGMEGYYTAEWKVGEDNGDQFSQRLRHVGLRGAFGEIEAGTVWDDTYNWVFSKTDMSPNHAGAFAWYFRNSRVLQYRTPDLNGFQAGIRLAAKETSTGKKAGSCSFVGEAKNGQLRHNPDANGATTGTPVGTSRPTRVALTTGSTSSHTHTIPDASRQQPAGAPAQAGDVTCSEGSSAKKDDNDIDSWALNAQYNVAGFNVAGSYERIIDGLNRDASGPVVTGLGTGTGTNNAVQNADINTDGSQTGAAADTYASLSAVEEDMDRWAVGVSYSQDNWYVGGWYGVEENTGGKATHYDLGEDGDVGGTDDDADTVGSVVEYDEDSTTFSLGGNVTVDKVNLWVVYETEDNVKGMDGIDDSRANVGVLYNLGSFTNVWVEYVNQDLDSKEEAEDFVYVGLRHNF